MCEPASLALAVFTSFKEVYLVCRFVYRVNVSKQNATPERRELESKFRYEVLFLQSLGQCFFQNGQIVQNEGINRRWLKQMHEIIERLRLLVSDYSRIAAEEDLDYQTYSPFLNSSMFDTLLVEFDVAEELPQPPKRLSISTKALRWLGIKASQKVNENLDAWKWALVEKRKFEAVLVSLQEENRRLKDLLPLMSALPIQRLSGASQNDTDMIHDEGSRRLGLATHARLKEIVSNKTQVDRFPTLTEKLQALPGQTLEASTSPLRVCKVIGTEEKVLVEYKQYQQPQDSTEEEKQLDLKRAHQLASLLCSAGSGGDMATLGFRGFAEEPQDLRHTFAFDFPPGTDKANVPMSLFDMISRNKPDIRLNLQKRFLVAATITKALATLHSDGWVHKSLRSDSIIFFRQALTGNLLDTSPYLVNFEYSRPQTSQTKLEFDNDYERNLYRHPDRQGEPRTSFTKLHDIYALGVVLLEIGLWQTASSMVKEVHVPSGRQISVQSILKQLTKRRLAHWMGPAYAEAVLSCLDDRFELHISDVDFPMVFHDEVIRKIDVRALWDSRVQ